MHCVTHDHDCQHEHGSHHHEHELPDGVYSIKINIVESSKNYVVTAMLPGIASDDMQLKATPKGLVILAVSREPELSEGEAFHVVEIPHGRLIKRISFAQEIQDDKIDAAFTNGLLKITLPKVEEQEAKNIPIRVTE